MKYYIAGFKQQLEALDTVGFNTLLSRSISFLYLVESWIAFEVHTGRGFDH